MRLIRKRDIFLADPVEIRSCSQGVLRNQRSKRLTVTIATALAAGTFLAADGQTKPPYCPTETDAIARRVFTEYGAVFAAVDTVRLPDRCIFNGDKEVVDYHRSLKIKSAVVGSSTIELQEAAMNALLLAIDEAERANLRITPLDGSIAAGRSYADTVRLWNSRFLRALNHWVRQGKISPSEAEAARTLPASDQVRKVMEWEARGWFFSTNFSRSIFSSAAPPGTSQHLSLTAFDVVEYGNPRIRSILNKHGWFQTVAGDEPHFTYLGLAESELPMRGLKPVIRGGCKFWVPKVD